MTEPRTEIVVTYHGQPPHGTWRTAYINAVSALQQMQTVLRDMPGTVVASIEQRAAKTYSSGSIDGLS